MGFGALVWLVMFAAASAIVGFGAAIGTGWGITLAVAVGILAYVAGVFAESENSGQALGYGLVFAAVGLILDFAISARFAGSLSSQWTYWLGYALVLFAPWLEYELQGGNAHAEPV